MGKKGKKKSAAIAEQKETWPEHLEMVDLSRSRPRKLYVFLLGIFSTIPFYLTKVILHSYIDCSNFGVYYNINRFVFVIFFITSLFLVNF